MDKLLILKRYRRLTLIAIFGLIGYWIYSFFIWDKIIVDTHWFYIGEIKYSVKYNESNDYAIFDSLARNECSRIFKNRVFKYYSSENDVFISFDYAFRDSSVIELSSYQYCNGKFRRNNGLFFRSDRLDIYSPWSNFKATNAVKEMFEKEVLSCYTSEFKQITPVRDIDWWRQWKWNCIYRPFVSSLILIVFCPIIVYIRNRINAKIRKILS